MSEYIKKFFVITVFYTILLHPEWAHSVADTAEAMGMSISGLNEFDPSSVLSTGISLANTVLMPVAKLGILSVTSVALLVLVVYGFIIFIFIDIAMKLALTLIMTTALISVSCFFLGFAALEATTAIARQALDVILASCVKLLGYYVVIGVGIKSINLILSSGGLPATPEELEIAGFDVYMWLSAAVWLFYLVAKNLPEQMAKIVSSGIQETRGTEMAALMMSAAKMAGSQMISSKSPAGMLAKGAIGLAKIASNATGVTALAGVAAKAVSAVAEGAKNMASNAASQVGSSIKSTVSNAASTVGNSIKSAVGLGGEKGAGAAGAAASSAGAAGGASSAGASAGGATGNAGASGGNTAASSGASGGGAESLRSVPKK